MTGAGIFTAADRAVLAQAGISPEDAANQLLLLRGGMHPPRLLRPCRRGDGIAVPDPEEFEALGALYQKACAEGRWVFFIPASGAATRMAASLADPAFVRDLAGRPGHAESALPELLKDPASLSGMPKALMPFHRQGAEIRTPIEEHIREATALASGTTARLHFTISPEHEKAFRAETARVLARLRAEGIAAEVTHSFQDPATQTIALDAEGNPFRDASGSLLLRPGGHGSLLRNLRDCGGEFAWIRNIDNIPVERLRAEGRALRRALGGLLMRAASRAQASGDRPARVAGMVKNTGEPGGGPFWIQGTEGPEIRVVEGAEVDRADPDQLAIFNAATHFNPVDMACALRDPAGRPFPLEDFAEPSACFVADKTQDGRAARALEWPGLWNGAMARWDTLCVEIPLSQFAPVKTVADLLRAEHLG